MTWTDKRYHTDKGEDEGYDEWDHPNLPYLYKQAGKNSRRSGSGYKQTLTPPRPDYSKGKGGKGPVGAPEGAEGVEPSSSKSGPVLEKQELMNNILKALLGDDAPQLNPDGLRGPGTRGTEDALAEFMDKVGFAGGKGDRLHEFAKFLETEDGKKLVEGARAEGGKESSLAQVLSGRMQEVTQKAPGAFAAAGEGATVPEDGGKSGPKKAAEVEKPGGLIVDGPPSASEASTPTVNMPTGLAKMRLDPGSAEVTESSVPSQSAVKLPAGLSKMTR